MPPITMSAPIMVLSPLGALSAHQAMRSGRPVAPIRAIGWHARAPHIVASASALEDAQQAAVPVPVPGAEGLEDVAEGLEGLGKSVAQGFEGLVNVASSPTEDLDRIMGAGTVTDLSNAFGLRTSMDALRTNFDKVGVRVRDRVRVRVRVVIIFRPKVHGWDR